MATKSKLTRIEKRKRLEALFDRGGYVRFNADAEGRPIIEPDTESDTDMRIWVTPPSPLQREMAIREAQAGRARAMLDARDNDTSQQWLTIHAFIRELPTDQLLDYILDLDDIEFVQQARRDVLTQEEWEDFNALRDAMRQFEEAGSPKDDPEWAALLDRDHRFTDQVETRADEIRGNARAGYKMIPRQKLEEKALNKRIEQAGSAVFVAVYENWLMFYACRDDEDHKILYFDSPDDIKGLPDEAQTALSDKLASFITEAAEAKN